MKKLKSPTKKLRKTKRINMDKLDVILINDGGMYVAQCLQYDIATQGDTIDDAKRAFEYVVAAEIGYCLSSGRTLADLPAAPKCYWDLLQ